MKKFQPFFWGATALLALFAVLQIFCRYHFFYQEQIQLFLFSADYASRTIFQIGGFSQYLSRFIVQFFLFPYVGAAFTACLIGGIAWQNLRFLRSVSPDKNQWLLPLLPAISLIVLQFDFSNLMQGTVSYLFMTALLAAYVRIGKPSLRLTAGLLALPALYYLAGPVANLAAVLIVVWEMQRGELRWYTSLLLLAETLLLSSASVWMGMMGSFRLAMLPDAYLDPLLQDKKIYIPWIAFFASTVLTLLFKKRLGFLARNPLPWTGVQFLVLVLAGYGLIHQSRDKSLEKLEELNYYMQMERWNEIITSASEATENPEVTSYLNLALARNGELGEKLFCYQQSDFKSLIPEWDFTPFTSALLSNIHFCMNNVASAQKYAFEGNLASISEGCPNLLQRLVETNLIYGAYPVAEKYINLLEQTLFYNKWAYSRRKFLRNDTLVESDPLLGNKRRSLFNADKQPAESSVLVDVLEKLAINNPSDQASMQYLTSILLVNRDLTRFKSLLEKHYGTRVWPGLTRSQQEAVLAISPDAAYGWAHGVSYATGERFDEFRKASYDNQGGAEPNETMSGFKDTFWYFLLFTKQ